MWCICSLHHNNYRKVTRFGYFIIIGPIQLNLQRPPSPRQKRGECSREWVYETVFQHVKSKLSSPEASISLKIGAKLLTDDFDIAEAFNDQFSSVFVQDDGKIPQTVLPQINSQLDDWLFSRSNVEKVLHSLRPDSAPGPDGIPSLR